MWPISGRPVILPSFQDNMGWHRESADSAPALDDVSPT